MNFTPTTTTDGLRARAFVETRMQKNLQNALQVLEKVQNDIPVDRLASAVALDFTVPGNGEPVVLEIGNQAQTTLHPFALRQASSIAGIPIDYVTRLTENPAPWAGHILTTALNTTFQHSPSRHLVRTVRGETRAILSDRYRRFDTRPILDSYRETCRKYGAVVYDGYAGDTRLNLKALIPTVYEPIPNEFVVLGVEWGTSDYGDGAQYLREFALRCMCLNGLVGEDALRQVHLGRRLTDETQNFTFSQKTITLDTQAACSAIKDVLNQVFDVARGEGMLGRIARAQEKEISWAGFRNRYMKLVNKSELELLEAAFTGPDVQNLPPGNTAWRASNAFSWVAQSLPSIDRQQEFARLAGDVLKIAA